MAASDYVFGIISLLISVCLVATSAIGIKCMNDNDSYADKQKVNKQFLIFTVVCGVLGILASIASMVMAAY